MGTTLGHGFVLYNLPWATQTCSVANIEVKAFFWCEQDRQQDKQTNSTCNEEWAGQTTDKGIKKNPYNLTDQVPNLQQMNDEQEDVPRRIILPKISQVHNNTIVQSVGVLQFQVFNYSKHSLVAFSDLARIKPIDV